MAAKEDTVLKSQSANVTSKIMKFVEIAVPSENQTNLSQDVFMAILQLISHPDLVQGSKAILE